jgi:hypothetical protein
MARLHIRPLYNFALILALCASIGVALLLLSYSHFWACHRPPKFHPLPAVPGNSRCCGEPVASKFKAARAPPARMSSIERKLPVADRGLMCNSSAILWPYRPDPTSAPILARAARSHPARRQ